MNITNKRDGFFDIEADSQQSAVIIEIIEEDNHLSRLRGHHCRYKWEEIENLWHPNQTNNASMARDSLVSLGELCAKYYDRTELEVACTLELGTRCNPLCQDAPPNTLAKVANRYLSGDIALTLTCEIELETINLESLPTQVGEPFPD